MIWTYGFKKGRERVYFLNEHKRDLLNKSTSTFLLNRILYGYDIEKYKTWKIKMHMIFDINEIHAARA